MSTISRMHRLLLSICLLSASAAWSQTTSQWRDSLDLLNREIARFPHNVDLRLRKAAVNVELAQWDYAIEEYARVLSIDPQNVAARYFRAYANMHLRQYGLARADYDALLQRFPRHLEARLGLATVLERMGRESDARDELNRLVDLHPDSAVAYAARAAFETSRQQWDIALYDWSKALLLSPGNLEYAVSRIDVLIRMGRKKEARKELDGLVSSRRITRAQLHEWYEKCR